MSNRRSILTAGLVAGAAAATLAGTVKEAKAQQVSKILGEVQSRGTHPHGHGRRKSALQLVQAGRHAGGLRHRHRQ